MEGRSIRRDHVVRPHIECLLALREHFRLGIYSSAMRHTIDRALALVRSNLLAMRRQGVEGEQCAVLRGWVGLGGDQVLQGRGCWLWGS
jgi:hypothetical protein